MNDEMIVIGMMLLQEKEKELTKYKRVFEILKEKLKLRTFYIEDEYFCNKKYALHSDGSVPLEKEEAELIEEVLSNENT